MDELSDVITFEKIRLGDEVAYSNLFDQYYTVLCFFADKYLHDMDSSRSLVQGLFVDLWDKRAQISIDSSLKSYLYFSIKNRSIDQLRKNKRMISLTEESYEVPQVSFDDLVESAELSDNINACINRLPMKCKEVFLLSRFEGLKYSEIAKKLNISQKTVEMQVSIALKRLRKSLPIFLLIIFFVQ